MKQFISFSFIMALMALAFVACDEGVDSKKHVYTEEEIRWRDSLEAVRNNINADYVFTYDLEVPLDTINYRGVTAEVDTDILLEKLGFASTEALTTALGVVNASVQEDYTVAFFAINNSTRYDYTGKLTTATHGHWFDKSGDVCEWDKNDALFSELNPEEFTFFIGQHPKHVKTGEKYKLIQVMSNEEDYRVAFVFNVTIGDYYKEEVPKAVNVATFDLTLEVTPDNTYATTDLVYDFGEAADAIGVSEEELSSNLTFYGISSDESMTANYTAAPSGYWYSADGDVIEYGEDCSYFINYEDGVFPIGQFPDACQPGDEFTFSVAIMYKTTKMVTYNITVKVK